MGKYDKTSIITYGYGHNVNVKVHKSNNKLGILDVTNINFDTLNNDENYLRSGLKLNESVIILTGVLTNNLNLSNLYTKIIVLKDISFNDNCKVHCGTKTYSSDIVDGKEEIKIKKHK